VISTSSARSRSVQLGEGGAALIAVANYYDELTHDLPCRKAMERLSDDTTHFHYSL